MPARVPFVLGSNLFDALLLLIDILGHEETLERSPEHMLAQNTDCGRLIHTLAINFDPQIITLFKEVRNLLWLGFSVPHAIGNIAKDAKRVYPYAVSLVSRPFLL